MRDSQKAVYCGVFGGGDNTYGSLWVKLCSNENTRTFIFIASNSRRKHIMSNIGKTGSELIYMKL